MAAVTAPDCPFSGPGCTFGTEYAYRECYDLVKPSVYNWTAKARVAMCIYDSTNQFEQTLLSTGVYILTLFPAIVGIIGSFGPDARELAYDNIWWSALFAVTSAGLPGYVRDRPPHHLTVDTFEEGESLCKEWKYSRARLYTVARHANPQVYAGGKITAISEIAVFLMSVALFVFFNYFFTINLSTTLLFGRTSPYIAATWYWMSASPSILLLFAEILQDRVDLYEPCKQQTTAPDPANQKGSSRAAHLSPRKSRLRGDYSEIPLSQQTATLQFARVSSFTVPFFSKWCRVIGHQWRRTQYRLLVKPVPPRWYYYLWNLIVGLFRLALFTVGSASLGSVVLFPPGNANAMVLGFLVAATGLPRLSFPALWGISPSGADLVVRIEPVEVRTTSSQ